MLFSWSTTRKPLRTSKKWPTTIFDHFRSGWPKTKMEVIFVFLAPENPPVGLGKYFALHLKIDGDTLNLLFILSIYCSLISTWPSQYNLILETNPYCWKNVHIKYFRQKTKIARVLCNENQTIENQRWCIFASLDSQSLNCNVDDLWSSSCSILMFLASFVLKRNLDLFWPLLTIFWPSNDHLTTQMVFFVN